MDKVAHDLPDLYSSHLPADIALDYHPSDSEYIRGIEYIKTQIIVHSRTMPTLDVKVVKLANKGVRTAQIAKDLEITASRVSRIKGTDDAKKLLSMLAYLNTAIDGPREDQRRHVLWRLVQQNIDKDGRLALSAITELNRMAAADRVIAIGSGGAGGLNITINNNIPRGELDK